MSSNRHHRPHLHALLSFVAIAAALRAQGTPIGFEETYALASDRGKAVATLIPGTDDWYYYHCRERLDARDFATVRRIVPGWIQRHGRNQRVIEIENREALLAFGDDRERTFTFLRERLGLTFGHQPVVPGAASDLPTALDPALISPATLTERALRYAPDSVDGFTERALAALAAQRLTPQQLRSLLARLDRPDVDNLPALIVRDLEDRSSGGFGSLPVHDLLRREHLEELLRLQPALLQHPRFVNAYLVRLQPGADVDWRSDPALRSAQLQRLWEFAQRLTPAFNSLKAHVLFHWLQHDLMQGAPDRERFLAYIRLPRRTGHPAEKHLLRFQRGDELVNLGSAFPTGLPAIGDDEALVRACLEHFFAREDNYTAYAEFLDADWLKQVLAETKILAGDGDLERWYSMLGDPARVEQLKQRIELLFPATNRTRFAADDPVTLAVDTKNVPTLLVKVFAIDAYRYLVDKQRDVDASIELDGVVANVEQTYTYTEPPVRRVRRTFELPMLREPGVYVVELVGNGISSRAVIHKGGLRCIARTAAAGQMLTVWDEAGRRLADATAWFGGREYAADDKGEILVPFSTAPGEKKVVLRHGSRSAISTFPHVAEVYELRGDAFLDREALLAGRTARIAVRPQLRLAGHDVALSLLTDRVLTIVATDLDGLSTTQEVRDPVLADERELVHEVQVPERLRALQVTLRGTVKDIAGKDVPLSAPTTTFAINGIDQTAETGTAMLLRTSDGYVVELRGKNGEPLAGRVCSMRLVHRDYRDPVDAMLQTDASGRIQLGPLAGITGIDVQRAGGTPGHFAPKTEARRLPPALQGRAGDTLRVPYQGSEAAPTRTEFSLLGDEHDEFARLAIDGGFLELRGLPPGDYELRDHRTGERVPVRVTAGERDGRWVVGKERVLAASDTRPLQIGPVQLNGGELQMRVANATPGTRVHVVATRYLPAFEPFAALTGAAAHDPEIAGTDPTESSYHSGRTLGDEYRYVLERRFQPKYAGNMLARPSLLLNPWRIDDTANDATGFGSKYGSRFGRGAGPGGVRPPKTIAPGEPTGSWGSTAGVFANLDYLPRGSTLLANLVPDKDGIVRVKAADLGDGQVVHVVALDGDQAIYATAVRDEAPLAPRARTLTNALDVAAHFVEQRRIQFVAAGGTAVLDDARSAQVEIHDSLASVYRLFATISHSEDLAKFAFVLDWPQRTPAEKQKLYSEHGCHELAFFLHEKDPEFFAAVVKPFLLQKLDKTFLDHWLLEDDLHGYLEPWAFAQLNLIERILLAHRLGGDDRAAIARAAKEALELRPVNRERLNLLFDLALKSDELAAKVTTGGNDFYLGRGPADRVPPATPPEMKPQADPAQERDFAEGKKREENEKNKDAKGDDRDDMRKLAEAQDQEAGDTVADRDKERARRGAVHRLFRTVDATKRVVEHNWWHRRMADSTPDVVAPNRFWVDYATAPADQPFVSAALVEASGSFLEMMVALSVLDLPFTAGKHEITADGDRRTLRAATPLLLVRKEVTKTEPAADQPPLLLGQNLYRVLDRYRVENGERRDVFVTDEFLVDVPYGCQVVVTNPTSSRRTADVLLQIPAGAVPLQKGFWTKGVPVELQPYATTTIEYAFYFPAAGSFAHYGAHAAENGKLAAAAEPRTLKVALAPSKIDTTSWEHVSQQGTAAEVMSFVDTHNVQGIELAKVAWRMKDREFFTALLGKLRARHVYDDTLWSYAILHRDPAATGEFLRHAGEFLAQCGRALVSPLVTIDPKERHTFEHVEFDPLVHPRAHRLGSQRVLGNADLARQYQDLMVLLGYHSRLDADDWLAVAYFLSLQDRIDEALDAFAKIDATKVAARVQYDYLAAWLCFFTGDVQKARTLAERHRDDTVPHWQQRFRDVLAQLDEAAGKAAQSTDAPGADQAALAPALELAIADRNVQVTYKNLARCEVRYYELDVEFAFSSQPFASDSGTSAAYVQPNLRDTKDLPEGQTQVAFALPERFLQKNVLVEVRAGGLVRSRQYFANALNVRFLESYGQVAVTAAGEQQAPLPKTYVKVFAKLGNGQVRFHKDGYTDLRGRFDYASLSDDPNLGAIRYAVLVLDEQRGAVIREVAPPAR